MRHSSQSDEAPPTSCAELFQGGGCDLDSPAPPALARSSSASDVMEPFIADRVKGSNPPTDTSFFTASSHTAHLCSHPPRPSSPTQPLHFTSERHEPSVDEQSSRVFASEWLSHWDSAFREGGVGGSVLGEEDLFSVVREYLTHRAAEGEEKEAREGRAPVPVQSRGGRVDHTGQAGGSGGAEQAGGGWGQGTGSVRLDSTGSSEDNESAHSIYQCLELQCPSLGTRGGGNLERPVEEKETGGVRLAGPGENAQGDKEEAISESVQPAPHSAEPFLTPQTLDSTKSKLSHGGARRPQCGGVHVSFRPSTESVQFHNPPENKEAHWRARLRRLSHFHTHSHSAGGREGAGPGGKLGAGRAGKFVSRAAVGHNVRPHESLSGGAAEDGSEPGLVGAGGGEVRQQPAGSCACEPQSSTSGPACACAGVRGRLGRSAPRPRASRSRSQEPGTTSSRHHQGALLGGVYKTVVHVLSSKPRPRGQGSSQGSSPQRQGRTATGDASLRDLYSHVLGYFGRKTSAPGEDGGQGGTVSPVDVFFGLGCDVCSHHLAETHHLAPGLRLKHC